MIRLMIATDDMLGYAIISIRKEKGTRQDKDKNKDDADDNEENI